MEVKEMTRNQIAYQELQETRRANAAREAETMRRNSADIAHQQSSLSEAARHNVAGERQASATLSESVRHNIADERLRSGTLAETTLHNRNVERETVRANVATEKQRLQQLAEDKRAHRAAEANVAYSNATQRMHNINSETETERSNRANEAIRDFQAQTAKFDANTRRSQMMIASRDQQERARHNVVTEGYTSTHYDRMDDASRTQAEAAWQQADAARVRNSIERDKLGLEAIKSYGSVGKDFANIVLGFIGG
nr:putative ORF1 [Marmot picobirnavirus]